MSEQSQKVILWWSLGFMIVFGLSWTFLLGMVPTPPAYWTPSEVAAFYAENATRIKLGAFVASYTSAFMVPFSTVVSVQMARIEKGTPVWAMLSFAGGILMSIFLVFPPLMWGVCAFHPARLADATSLMNEYANLMLATTDQYYIFQMVGIVCVSLKQDPHPDSAFPRWMGWGTLWAAAIFELGAPAFFFKTGPFAWNGVLVFWLPFFTFFTWLATMFFTMFRAIGRQSAAKARGPAIREISCLA